MHVEHMRAVYSCLLGIISPGECQLQMRQLDGGGSTIGRVCTVLLTSCSIAVGSSTASSPSTLIRLLILTLGLGGSSKPCLRGLRKHTRKWEGEVQD